MSAEDHIVIVGAGPTGLGAAWRLHELGYNNWTLIDAADYAGGLATSVVDEQGFTWDLGGHVLFSHYKYFDQLMDQALGDDWLEHIREAWVWMRERWVPYPFQNNIWRLPESDLIPCLDGLLEVYRAANTDKPDTFREWLLQSFGQGLCDTFMFPYNYKVWAYRPEKMNVEWMGERVAEVDLSRVIRNLVKKQDDVSWGPNATFRFPLHGGTGAIWRSISDQLPAGGVKYGAAVKRIDPDKKKITLEDGESLEYDKLISTIPLDQLLLLLADKPHLSRRASEFVYSSTHVVGIGLDGEVPDELATKCWIYFPESNSPFYRVTVFSNYSPNNVARPGKQWSLMCEISESPDKPVNTETIVNETVSGLLACRLINKEHVIVSRWHKRLEYGYPTPWYGRDAVLSDINMQLTAMNIYSRGRFGAWKYEVSNQDHSVMQGVEIVNHILQDKKEKTFYGDMSDD